MHLRHPQQLLIGKLSCVACTYTLKAYPCSYFKNQRFYSKFGVYHTDFALQHSKSYFSSHPRVFDSQGYTERARLKNKWTNKQHNSKQLNTTDQEGTITPSLWTQNNKSMYQIATNPRMY